MKKSAVFSILVCLFTLCATQAWSWETRIINHTKYVLEYEVYDVTLKSDQHRECNGVVSAVTSPGDSKAMACSHGLSCFTRLNATVRQGNKDGSDHRMDTNWLGAQCWNHKVEFKQYDNGQFYWEWSTY